MVARDLNKPTSETPNGRVPWDPVFFQGNRVGNGEILFHLARWHGEV